MLSRIMRHPAGLVRMAWNRRFRLYAFQGPALTPAAPPDWWPGRYSAEGLLVALPAPAAPAPDGTSAGAPAEAPAPLPGHGGKAASYLRTGP